MLIMDSPAPTVEVVALLSTTTSHCEIRKSASDDEAGDPIEVRCGTIRKPLGSAIKGVSVNRVSACQVVMIVNAVHSPRLLNLSNCRGPLSVADAGGVWTKRLQKSADIKTGSIEFVAYEQVAGLTGCYNVTITYDAKSGGQNTSYKEKTGKFCVEKP